MVARTCHHRKADGSACRAPPLLDGEFCRMHSPQYDAEVKEARRLGGLRRRREVAVAGAYDFEGLTAVQPIRRIVEIAVIDALSLENSLSRARTLAYLAQVALKTLEVGEFEQRLQALETTIQTGQGGGRR